MTSQTICDPNNFNNMLKVNSDGSINTSLVATPTIDIGKVVVIDGTVDTIKQAVKAASTAAGATDPSAVVALSPNSPLPTGSNVVGAVTQSGTWNIGTVTTLPSIPAGSSVIGKVGIDQTTPGTTNGVQVVAAVPAGANIIGKVGIDQTTPGTTNGVYVNTIAAGQNNIGNVGGKTIAVTVTPTVTSANAYGTNYVVGGLLTFANAFTSTGSGILQQVTVTCKKVETVAFTFVPFNANPSNTTWTDAAAAAINAADVAAVRAPISLTNYSGLGTMTVISATGIGEAMSVGSTSLYGVLIVSGTLTNNFGSTSDITVTVTILQDV